MKWFANANFEKYKGQYIAILNEKVIASGNNAKIVWAESKKKYPKEMATLWKVPKKDLMVLSEN